MDKLVKEDTLTKSGTNTYVINKLKVFYLTYMIYESPNLVFLPWSSLVYKQRFQKSDYEFEAVKEENDGLIFRNGNKFQPNLDEDHMYMKVNMEQWFLTRISFFFFQGQSCMFLC